MQHSVGRIEKSLKTNDWRHLPHKKKTPNKKAVSDVEDFFESVELQRKKVGRNGHSGFHSTMRFGGVCWVGTGKVTWCYRTPTVLWSLDGQQIHHRIYLKIFDNISSAINYNLVFKKTQYLRNEFRIFSFILTQRRLMYTCSMKNCHNHPAILIILYMIHKYVIILKYMYKSTMGTWI